MKKERKRDLVDQCGKWKIDEEKWAKEHQNEGN